MQSIRFFIFKSEKVNNKQQSKKKEKTKLTKKKKEKKPKTNLFIKGALIEVYTNTNEDTTFSITVQTKPYTFKTDSKSERDDWMNVLTEASNKSIFSQPTVVTHKVHVQFDTNTGYQV